MSRWPDAAWLVVKVQQHKQVAATQVKSKLGGLRFYIRQASQRQRAMIALAEGVSMRMCEECGTPGEVVKNARRWSRVHCEARRS